MLMPGTVIVCPNCNKELLRVTKSIHDGAILKAEHLESINYTPENGMYMQCNACNTYWFRPEDGRVYTKDGWLS